MEINNETKFDLNKLKKYISSTKDIDSVFECFNKIKLENKMLFNLYIEKLKILFVLSDDYSFLSTSSLIFSEFKIHSAVHLIVAKLLSGKFNDSGGTFLYSLMSLKKNQVVEELRSLWSKEISWEMEQKLLMMNIKPH